MLIFGIVRRFRFEKVVALYVDDEENRRYHGLECYRISMGDQMRSEGMVLDDGNG